MKPIRSADAQRAFEQARGSLDESTVLMDVARRAARRARSDEVEVCVGLLRRVAPDRADALASELNEIMACVRDHPSHGAAVRRAS